MSYTPGPWIVVPFAGDQNAIPIRTPDEEIIATAWNLMKKDGTTPFTDNEANARLIAAAPDLLVAVKRMLGVYDPMAVDMMKAAVAKAEGTKP